VGVAKPDPRIYRIAAERLGVETGDCLFVDDQPNFVEGALAAGMDAVVIGDEPWDGPRVRSLEGVLELVQ
jgi:FMN phosphatase YigB (HAD superfamily)